MKTISKKLQVLALMLLMGQTLFAQESLEYTWQQVLKNNKKIAAGLANYEAEKLQAKVGITPDNPEIEYGYFPGNTSAIGTKQVFSVSQEIAPASFWYKRKVAQSEIEMLDMDKRLTIQEVLLDAWKTWCKVVYLNQMTQVMEEREENAAKVLASMQNKQLTGATTQLEVNKARLFHLEIANKTRLIKGQAQVSASYLKALNGGLAIAIADSSFSMYPLVSWESIKTEIDTSHLMLEKLEINQQRAKSELSVSKSAWVPKLMVGYESEDIQGNIYSGLKAGISIPLWQNKNAVSYAKAQMVYAKEELENKTLNIFADYEQRYIRVQALHANVTEFRLALSEINNVRLLNRSFELGQLSAIDYFRELNYVYEINDQLLNLELLYQLSLAGLYEYSL